jgi:hypothetical protein
MDAEVMLSRTGVESVCFERFRAALQLELGCWHDDAEKTGFRTH